MWKFLLPFAAFITLAVLFAFGLNPNRDIHALPSPLIGKPAPLFTLTDVLDASRTVSNAALKGQVYILNVWGTWCAECRAEHEELLAISQQHAVPLIGWMSSATPIRRWPSTTTGAPRSTGACTARRRPSWWTDRAGSSTSSSRR
jgi:AhpC/TSA family